MKLVSVWKRIGRQPLKLTRNKDAVVIVNGKEYPITSIKYVNGVFVGFEADIRTEDIVSTCENKECPHYQNCNKNMSVNCVSIILKEYNWERENCKTLIEIINDIADSTLGKSWYIVDPVNNMQGSEIIRDEIHNKYYERVNHKKTFSLIKKIFKNRQK